MKNKLSTIFIDKETKDKVQKIAKKLHLSISGIARILLNDFADGKIQIRIVMLSERSDICDLIFDVSNKKNIEGPFENAEDFISTMK